MFNGDTMEKPEGKSLERKRLTEEEKQKIIEMRNQGYSLNKISITLQRPHSTIANVIRKYKENQVEIEEMKENKKEEIEKLKNELEAKIKENDKLKEENQEMKKKLTKLFDLITELYNEIVVIKWI
jgi:IS30 family transposase